MEENVVGIFMYAAAEDHPARRLRCNLVQRNTFIGARHVDHAVADAQVLLVRLQLGSRHVKQLILGVRGASFTPVPPVIVWRLPEVTPVSVVVSVSAGMTNTLLSSTPSSSAAIMAIVVFCPPPSSWRR